MCHMLMGIQPLFLYMNQTVLRINMNTFVVDATFPSREISRHCGRTARPSYERVEAALYGAIYLFVGGVGSKLSRISTGEA